MKIGSVELSSPLRLAPLADISNIPFRLVCKEAGSAMTTSEEIDSYSLNLGSDRSWRTAKFLPEEKPIALQLLGHDPKVLAECAKKLQDTGADIIDLNMGCPVPKITCKGEGSALMKDPAKAAEIFHAMRKAISIPLTIKIRGGWDLEHINAVEIAQIAEGEGVDAITVHPRTRSMRFTGKAPWEIIREVVKAVKIPITGNGDVKTHDDAKRMMAETGVESVMIGRGALGKPWIFNFEFEKLSRLEQVDYKIKVIRRHIALIRQYIFPKTQDFQIKKQLVWYASGLPRAAALRHEIFSGSPNGETAWNKFQEHWEKYAHLEPNVSLESLVETPMDAAPELIGT